MRENITMTKGDATDTIDELISFLKEAKEKGATHYSMRWSNDPMWAFKWFETYKVKTEQEVKNDKMKELQELIIGIPIN